MNIGEVIKLGTVHVTAAVQAWMKDDVHTRSNLVIRCLARHQRGEDGAIDPEDREVNTYARAHGERVLTVWPVPDGGEPLWIITEADRSSTCVLWPSDY